jgi:hypothetical protein
MLMFNAVHNSSRATIMHIRKWLRVLIDRSLVLGTIDRPSLHDLVLDFCVAQHTAQELYTNHWCVVQAFRAARPGNRHGRREFEKRTMHGSPVAKYVCNEVAHHLILAAKVLHSSPPASGPAVRAGDADSLTDVLADVPQDEIVRAAGQVLGLPHVAQVATSAEHAGDWWLAARYWALLARCHGHRNLVENCERSIAASEKVLKSTAAAQQPDLMYEVQALQLSQFRFLSTSMDEEAIGPHRSAMEQILESKAAADDMLNAATLELFLAVPTILFGADKRAAARRFLDLGKKMLQARSEDDPTLSYFLFILTCALQHHADLFLEWTPDYDFDYFLGEGGVNVVKGMEKYDFDTWHTFLIVNNNVDCFTLWVDYAFLAIHYGNMQGVYMCIDKSMEALRASMEMPEQTSELTGIMFAVPMNAIFMCEVGVPMHFRNTLCDMIEMYQMTFAGAHKVVDQQQHHAIRPRGDKTMNRYLLSAEFVTFMCEGSHVLLASVLPASRDDILERLLSVDEIIEFSMLHDSCAAHSSFVFTINPFIMAAAVCEKLEKHERTLVYAAGALCKDLTRAGGGGPTTRTVALSMQGRAYAALGRTHEAAVAFEAAAETARHYQLWLFEAFALRDLKLSVLDQMGQGEHGSRRLGVVLRLLAGPAKLLTPLLKVREMAVIEACARFK